MTNVVKICNNVNQRLNKHESIRDGGKTMNVSSRLKQLRLARGMSLEELSQKMGGIVTKQALSKYEQGKANPQPRVLTKLSAALGVKAAHLFSEPRISVEFVAYRKCSKLPKKEQTKVENFIKQELEERVRLQELLKPTNGSKLPVHTFQIKSAEDAEKCALDLRKQWSLGTDPIANVTAVLEAHLVHVFSIEASEGFEGLSAIVSNDAKQTVAAAVVTRQNIYGDRQRLNLTHELAHLVLDVPADFGDEEKAAFRFAGAFLAPEEALRREIGAKRTTIGKQEFLLMKQRFGISMGALIFRLRDLDIISEHDYRRSWIYFNKEGWRKKEPGPQLPPEKPQWLRQNVYRLLSEGMMDKKTAATLLGEKVKMETTPTLSRQRALMKLPMEKRREIMKAQAEKAADMYEKDKGWKEWSAGDIVEH